MKQLFLSEWQRMWNRKSTWSCFGLIPIIVFMFVKYYLKSNLKFTSGNAEYITFLKFPSAVLRINLLMFFNIVVILLIIMSLTSEYRSGQLRMIMIRAVSFGDIMKAKFLVILSTVFIFLSTHFVISTVLGCLYFPHKTSNFISYRYSFTVSEGILYNLKYYIIAFITLTAVASVIMFICINCKTTTGAVAGSLTFIVTSVLYPTICELFLNKMSPIIDYPSLVSIEDHGILSVLAQNPQDVGLIIFIIALYIGVFFSIAFTLLNDQDCYI